MLAYKKLMPRPGRGNSISWWSPARKTRWANDELHVNAHNNSNPDAGIYACTRHDNPELDSYQGILVELEVWGTIRLGENGVLAAEHARIVRPLATQTQILEVMLENLKGRLPKWFTREHALLSPKCALYYAVKLNLFNDSELRALALQSPGCAVEWALYEKTPSDDTRQAACRSFAYAYEYAMFVDKAPRDDTRHAVLTANGEDNDDSDEPEMKRARYAFSYALMIDKQPRDDTRACACNYYYTAYEYALQIDKQPRDDTRNAVLVHPDTAYRYARHIDKQPRDDTRRAACADPYVAVQYALYVDKQPRDDTRQAASRVVVSNNKSEVLYSALSAYTYALQVDKKLHPVTRAAIAANPVLRARIELNLKED